MPSVKGKGNGGKRPGAGRKSKAEEMGLKALLNECWTVSDRKEAVKALAARAKQGDLAAITLLMQYAFGKPKEQIEHTGKEDGPITLKVVYVTKNK
jgi:hypothetical protein